MSKLDIKTKLFLFITKAKIVKYDICDDIKIANVNKYEVYVFDNYKEYENYFKSYLKIIDENVIKQAIYKIGKNGQIIAFKGLCERIIIN